MSATNKIIWILGLLCAFLFILITGRTNIQNFEKVQSSIEEIYKDRLVVKGLIFELSSNLHKKEVAILSQDKSYFSLSNNSINTQMAEYIRAFKETKLTSLEEETLLRFSTNFENLKKLEKEFDFSKETSKKVFSQIAGLKEDLKTLSGIQLTEGKKKLSMSGKAVASMNFFAQVENYMLIIFGALVLVLIFVVPGQKSSDSP